MINGGAICPQPGDEGLWIWSLLSELQPPRCSTANPHPSQEAPPTHPPRCRDTTPSPPRPGILPDQSNTQSCQGWWALELPPSSALCLDSTRGHSGAPPLLAAPPRLACLLLTPSWEHSPCMSSPSPRGHGLRGGGSALPSLGGGLGGAAGGAQRASVYSPLNGAGTAPAPVPGSSPVPGHCAEHFPGTGCGNAALWQSSHQRGN